jgi:hypothetical protein
MFKATSLQVLETPSLPVCKISQTLFKEAKASKGFQLVISIWHSLQ